MRHDDPYEAWKHACARADVPAGFTDRVLAAARARQEPRTGWLAALLLSPAVRVGIASLACAACLLRLLQVVGLLLVGQPSM
jgi:hypothetical protein